MLLVGHAPWAQPLLNINTALHSYICPCPRIKLLYNINIHQHTHIQYSYTLLYQKVFWQLTRASVNCTPKQFCKHAVWHRVGGANRDKRLYLACKCPWDQISQGSTCHDVFKRLMVADRDRHQPQSKSAKLLCGTGLAGQLGQTNSASLYMCLWKQLESRGQHLIKASPRLRPSHPTNVGATLRS